MTLRDLARVAVIASTLIACLALILEWKRPSQPRIVYVYPPPQSTPESKPIQREEPVEEVKEEAAPEPTPEVESQDGEALSEANHIEYASVPEHTPEPRYIPPPQPMQEAPRQEAIFVPTPAPTPAPIPLATPVHPSVATHPPTVLATQPINGLSSPNPLGEAIEGKGSNPCKKHKGFWGKFADIALGAAAGAAGGRGSNKSIAIGAGVGAFASELAGPCAGAVSGFGAGAITKQVKK